ncbi:MAG: helix-turn-helix domain-containing protein [Chloroflexi bacterium]|uniref:Helix-turn-helix domain-containing protein n=1 Tax=Candidatus Chlorohelix allophototropha TaxID=3003348 RepID=A0A8T7M3U8_9CHLR|nr:helix-turn-helix domain-containing protein [Chloroflexota bacterium]WJW66115.1 helix-turn-helix domain-containing protein [Chloroflexota bacterium L227-S17]NWJ46746.1 helix-turn-helix domain-containing protein [Chloroflexota bacterium]NWJ47582.1 helix-turn-helix domain-containing protein [Chloroflexota bacterium]WJW67566.1 helix-turn-helix domain-containing protein [Chloroflexota bacterium L227-S17]
MFERKSACLLPRQVKTEQLECSRVEQVENQEFEPVILSENEQRRKVGLKLETALTTLENEDKEISAEETPLTIPISRKDYLFEHIKALCEEGLTQRRIARELRISRQTVKKYLIAEQVPRYTPRASGPSILDLYKPYIALR